MRICRPSGFLSRDGFRALDFSFSWKAVNASFAGLGRIVVRIVVCGRAVMGLFIVVALAGSYFAELSSNGGGSISEFWLSGFGWDFIEKRSLLPSWSDPELSGVGS